jgi:2-aminoadipate transaminase
MSVAVESLHSVRFARRMEGMKPSAVREILKVADHPDILSFAGGLPAPELFPVAEIAAAHAKVLATDGAAALQYSVTEGYGPLRDWIATRLRGRGIATNREQVLVTTGSQQGIDLVAKVLLDPGDVVVVENPSYLAALQVFAGAEAELDVVGSDDDGMRVDELEALLARRTVKLIYIVADFNNPKGTTLSVARRLKLVELATRHNVIILEDDPYGELRFRGVRPPSLAALDEAGVVLQLGTFSKTLAPGLRIGWITGAPELIRACTTAKQAADLHSGNLSQRATSVLLETFDYDGHLDRLRAVYGARCDDLLGALTRHLPTGSKWTQPDGGLFVWVELPAELDAEQVLAVAVQHKVAFVPGRPFFAKAPRANSMRLNFSNRGRDQIEFGMTRLGEVIRIVQSHARPTALLPASAATGRVS